MISRELCKQIRPEITEILEVIGKKYGLKFSCGNMSYTSETINIKVTATDTNIETGSMARPKEAKAYLELAEFYGLKKEWLEVPYFVNGKVNTIVGLATGSRKYPILVKVNDKVFKYQTETIKTLFRNAVPIS